MFIKCLFRHKLATFTLLILLIIRPIISAWCGFKAAVLFDSAYDGDIKMVLNLFAILFVVWIINSLFQYWSRLLRAYVVVEARKEIKNKTFSSLMKINMASFFKKEPGDYIATFTNDITMLDIRYFDALVEMVEYIITIFIIGGSFFALDISLAIVIVIGGLMCGIVPIVLTKYTVKENKKFINTFESFTQRIKEYFGAFQTVKNYSVESKINEKFTNINNATENSKFDAEFALEFANSLGGTLSWFVRFAVVGLGLIKVVQGDLTMGLVYTAYSFANELATPLQGIIHKINSVRSVKAISEKFTRINQLAIDENQKSSFTYETVNSINFNHVNFSVGDYKIISDFSFAFEHGKKYLIIGKNGSGKSTLFKLLKRVMDNFEGEILINGRDVRNYPYPILSAFTSYLNEKVDILSATVKDNITLFRNISDEDLIQAIKKAKINIPLDKVLNDSGSNISSGEKRKIEIARSLVSKSPVLVFDEVISTLDIETAFEIESLALSLKDETVVFISHNFSGKNVCKYDEILLIDDGRLIDHGTHTQLLAKCKLYQKLNDIRNG